MGTEQNTIEIPLAIENNEATTISIISMESAKLNNYLQEEG